MLRIFSSNWKYIAGGGTVLAYDAWLERIRAKVVAGETKAEFKEILNKIGEAVDKTSENVAELRSDCSISASVKSDLDTKYTALTTALGDMKRSHEKYIGDIEKGNISSTPEQAISKFDTYKETFMSAFKRAEEAAEGIDELIRNTKTKLTGGNDIFNIINDFQLYLSSLSTTEICLVINIGTSIFILGCIISILFAISGKYIINKFSLEQKFPRLKNIIQLRVKFQSYYVYINSIFIILAVLSLIITNYITLIYG